MTVYADVLFFINFAVNLPVLYLTGKLGRVKCGNLRLIFGSTLGAVYAVLMFFPRLSFGYSALSKILFSLFVIAVTFNIKGIRLYIKTVGIFYLVTFCLGGGVMALFYFTGMGQKTGAMVKNGILYMNLPPLILFGSVAVCYGVIRVLWWVLGNRTERGALLRKVGIFYGGKEVWLDALLDTGNALMEPFSGAPVIIAELEGIAPLLPKELRTVCETGTGVEEIADEKIRGRIRIIPFSSLGKEHGMLIGFRPDKAAILENEALKDAGEVVVGISAIPLSRDHSFRALLPPGI